MTVGEEYWEWFLRAEPTYATYLGDHRWGDRLPDVSPAGIARQRAELEALRARVSDREDVLERLIAHQIDERSHGFEQWSLDQLNGPQGWLLEGVNTQPLRNEGEFETCAARLRAFGPYVDDWLDNLRRGVEEGGVAPAIREFHDVVLRGGAVPLAVLDRNVRTWLE
jgi:uncharacterized protein (DUF885 family)